MPNNLINNEAQKLFSEIGIELRFFSERPQPRDLALFAPGVRGRKLRLGLVAPDRLRHFEPLSKHENERGIDIVDAVAILSERCVRHMAEVADDAHFDKTLDCRYAPPHERLDHPR